MLAQSDPIKRWRPVHCVLTIIIFLIKHVFVNSEFVRIVLVITSVYLFAGMSVVIVISPTDEFDCWTVLQIRNSMCEGVKRSSFSEQSTSDFLEYIYQRLLFIFDAVNRHLSDVISKLSTSQHLLER